VNDEGVARARVAWKLLCYPKREGGLGIKKVGRVESCFNYAANLELVCQSRLSMGCLGS